MHGNQCVHADCLYRAKIGTIKYCDHLEFTGHMRGCPSDERCTKYVHATKKERETARKKRYKNYNKKNFGRNYQDWQNIPVDLSKSTFREDNHGSAIEKYY